MDIGVPIKELGCYDIEPLKNKILSLPEEAWWGNQFRQLEYEVHQHTQSIVLVFTDGQGWPNIDERRWMGSFSRGGRPPNAPNFGRPLPSRGHHHPSHGRPIRSWRSHKASS